MHKRFATGLLIFWATPEKAIYKLQNYTDIFCNNSIVPGKKLYDIVLVSLHVTLFHLVI